MARSKERGEAYTVVVTMVLLLLCKLLCLWLWSVRLSWCLQQLYNGCWS